MRLSGHRKGWHTGTQSWQGKTILHRSSSRFRIHCQPPSIDQLFIPVEMRLKLCNAFDIQGRWKEMCYSKAKGVSSVSLFCSR